MLVTHTHLSAPRPPARPLPAEAAAWEQLARALHEEAPIGGLGSPPEAAFGTLDALTVRQGQPVRHRQAACLDPTAACLQNAAVWHQATADARVPRLPCWPAAGQGAVGAGGGAGLNVPPRAALPAVRAPRLVACLLVGSCRRAHCKEKQRITTAEAGSLSGMHCKLSTLSARRSAVLQCPDGVLQ